MGDSVCVCMNIYQIQDWCDQVAETFVMGNELGKDLSLEGKAYLDNCVTVLDSAEVFANLNSIKSLQARHCTELICSSHHAVCVCTGMSCYMSNVIPEATSRRAGNFKIPPVSNVHAMPHKGVHTGHRYSSR